MRKQVRVLFVYLVLMFPSEYRFTPSISLEPSPSGCGFAFVFLTFPFIVSIGRSMTRMFQLALVLSSGTGRVVRQTLSRFDTWNIGCALLNSEGNWSWQATGPIRARISKGLVHREFSSLFLLIQVTLLRGEFLNSTLIPTWDFEALTCYLYSSIVDLYDVWGRVRVLTILLMDS